MRIESSVKRLKEKEVKVGVESMKRKYREGENTREQGMKLRNLGEAKKEGEKGGRSQA